MSDSVSFILPVRDLEYELRDRLQVIFEILAELTDRFDVLIVNCGSRDETREVAMDLVREFPQVDFLDRGDDTDRLAAVEAGIQRTRGETIFIHDPTHPLGPSTLRSLWQMRNDDDLVMAESRASDVVRQSVLDRPLAAADRRSLQMIRRCALRSRTTRLSPQFPNVDRLTRTDLRDDSVESLRLPKLLTRLHGNHRR